MNNMLKSILNPYLPPVLISLLFVIPVINSSSMFNGLVSAKKYSFYIFMAAITFYYILFYFSKKSVVRISLNKVDIAFMLYVLWNMISAVITNDAYINDKTAELVFLTLYYFIIKVYLTNIDNHKIFVIITSLVLFTVAITECVIGYLQLYHIIPSFNPYFKITGTFNNPAPYALLLSVVYAYSLSVYSLNFISLKPVKYVAFGTCFLILSIIPFTVNRASWVGIIASTLMIVSYKLFINKHLINLNIWKKVGLVSVVVITIGVSTPYLYNLKRGSSDGRLLVWEVSGNIIKENPVSGIGFGRFRSEYNLYQAEYFSKNQDKEKEYTADDVQLAFNDYIETFVETGIIGIILFIYLIINVLCSFKNSRFIPAIFLIPFITILILSLFSYPINTLTTKILFFFLLGSLSGFILETGKSRIISLNRWVTIILLLGILSFSLVYINKYNKYKTFQYASVSYEAESFDVAEEYFRQVYKTLKYDSYFSLKFAECLYKNNKNEEALEILNHAQMIVPDPELYILLGNILTKNIDTLNAEQCLLTANFMTPGRILPKYFLTKFYYNNNDYWKADSLAKCMLSMEIKVKSDTTLALLTEIKKLYKKNNNRL